MVRDSFNSEINQVIEVLNTLEPLTVVHFALVMLVDKHRWIRLEHLLNLCLVTHHLKPVAVLRSTHLRAKELLAR